jgi:superfamily II DNA or RNA helicase
MSCQFNLKSLNAAQKNHIERELTIKPLKKQLNPFAKKKSYEFTQNNTCVETFDIDISDKNSPMVYLPFSYSYHNLKITENPNIMKADFTFEGSLLPRQKEIRDEVFEILNRTQSILLSLYTGFGKTIFAIYIASKINLKTVVLCHRKIIMDQWLDSINKYIPNCKAKIVEGNELVDKEYDICIMNVINVPKKHRNQYNHFGLVIVDECHTVCTQSFSQSLFYFFPKYVIGLSATPERSDGMDKIIEMFVGPEIISRKMYRLFNVYKLSTGFEPNVQETRSGSLDWNKVIESQGLDEDRNNLICKIVKYFSKRNILVLCKRKDHARILFEKLKKDGEEVDVFMDTQKTCNYNSRILIATYSKGGVGFDHPKLNMMITAADVLENFTQYLGRIFRTSDEFPIYVDLVDKFKPIYNHSLERIKICKALGGEVKKFNQYFKL